MDLKKFNPTQGPRSEIIIALVLGSILGLIVFCWTLISTAILPGGVTMRMLGLAVVGRDGMEISRVHSVVRAFTAWSPTIPFFLLAVIIVSNGPGEIPELPTYPLLGLALMLPVIGAVWTITHPTRGLHDRVMGTRVVPR